MSVLDIGCGTGTITNDLAVAVAPGTVIGIDVATEVVAAAAAESTTERVTYEVGDVMSLRFAAGTFDVVHAHQVLQHLREPVAALREMVRVATAGGIVTARDSDYGRFRWWPEDPRLDEWNRVYHGITTANGVEADAGRHLESWFRAAGLEELEVTSSEWRFVTDADRRWWGGTWADRVLHSSFAAHALEHGLADSDSLAGMAAAFLEWAATDGAGFVVAHVEVLARAPMPVGSASGSEGVAGE